MLMSLFFFFFNDTATTEIYTLSLHDALPIFPREPRRGLVRGGREPVRVEHRKRASRRPRGQRREGRARGRALRMARVLHRSEEHTSELQSLAYLVCRLLLEKKKKFTHALPVI